MNAATKHRLPGLLILGLLACAQGLLGGCGSSNTPPPVKTCDAECQDETSIRAVRESMKLAFNLTLQGKPVGPQDVRTPCPLGGAVRVFGEATSNAAQGATVVNLTYEFAQCAYLNKDDDAEENYSVTVTGSILQRGTIAVQPTSTTALAMTGEKIQIVGTVYDPPIDVRHVDCALALQQDGNKLTGKFCGRTRGLTL